MKTALAATLLALVVVSPASADHKHKARLRHASPVRLVQILHVQTQNLAEEIDYHYSPSEWHHHQMNRISRVADSIERDFQTGHLHRVHRNLHHIEHMLYALDLRVKRSVVVHDHAGAWHVTRSVKDMEKIVESFEHSLKHVMKAGDRDRHFVR